MATITIPDVVYERLAAQARERGTTVEDRVLEAIGEPNLDKIHPPSDLAEWKQNFQRLHELSAMFAKRRDPNIPIDVSRDSMYPDELP